MARGFAPARLLEHSTTFGSAVTVVVLLGVLPELLVPASPDVAWYLYIAGRMLAGDRLYVDLVEINPPLIIWLKLPVMVLASLTGLPSILLYRLCVTAVVGVAGIFVYRLLTRALPAATTGERRLLFLVLLFTLFPLAREDFGQREHLMLALVLPYVIIAALRSTGLRASRRATLAAGGMAGVGVALKPHFVLLWLGVEGYSWITTRRPPWSRPESVASGVMLLAYGVVALTAHAEYPSLIRTIGGAYSAYLRNSPLLIAANEPWVIFVIVALFTYAGLRTVPRLSHVGWALFVATLSLLLAALVQQKGWRYHLYPAFALAIGLLALSLQGGFSRFRGRLPQVYAIGVHVGMSLVFLFTLGAAVYQIAAPSARRHQPFPEYSALSAVVRQWAHGEYVVVLSPNHRSAFPLVSEAGARWGLRLQGVWILVGVYSRELMSGEPFDLHAGPEMSPAERYVRFTVVEDVLRTRPRLIIVLRPDMSADAHPARRFDYLGYFATEPCFRALAADYRHATTIGAYDVYAAERDDAPVPPACIAGGRSATSVQSSGFSP